MFLPVTLINEQLKNQSSYSDSIIVTGPDNPVQHHNDMVSIHLRASNHNASRLRSAPQGFPDIADNATLVQQHLF